MPKVWNIGNTTVRNPKRIENALKVYLEENFSGNAKGEDMETRLHFMLKEREVLDFDGEPSDFNGRKWRAAFYQLGFVSYEKYKIGKTTLSNEELFGSWGQNNIDRPYQITNSGLKLLGTSLVPEIEDIYLRQFACYELPNSLEPSYSGGSMKPFVLFVQVLRELQKQNMDGLNKFETGLFIQLFRDHTKGLVKEILDGVEEYREKIASCKNAKEVKEIKTEYLKRLGEASEINPLSVVNDYSDTTFRYFSLSGLFVRIGDTITIRDNKILFVDKFLAEEPKFFFAKEPKEYFKLFYNNTYPLPIDNSTFIIEEIKQLKETITNKENPLIAAVDNLAPDVSLKNVQDLRHQLIEYNRWEREADFANAQQSQGAITNTLKYLKTLNDEVVEGKPEIDDKPAYLEWAVWRGFLAIDEIVGEVHNTRRFSIDQDFLPRNTAPGGGSDLIFEFETYVLVVEVTLTTSHRQMAVESEPVRRHTVKYKELYPNKDTYCLFIAPEVDNNVAETFRIGVWYKKDEEEFINIIPLSLSDFNKTIEALLKKKYRNSDYRILLDRCLVSRNVRAPQWKKSISKEVDDWVKRICN